MLLLLLLQQHVTELEQIAVSFEHQVRQRVTDLAKREGWEARAARGIAPPSSSLLKKLDISLRPTIRSRALVSSRELRGPYLSPNSTAQRRHTTGF